MENTGCKKVKSMDGARNEQGVMADNNKMVSDATAGGQQDDSMFVPQGIKLLFENLSVEIKSSQNLLSTRIDNLEKDIECKIIEKITDLVSSTIKGEVNKLRDEYNSVIDSLNSKVAALEASFADIVKSNGNVCDPVTALEERKKRFVIKHLSEDTNESNQITMDKVNALIKDGCKLSDVNVTSVERKYIKGKKPGIAVATCASFEQKQKLMKAKSLLKNIQKYKTVYIENDYSQEIRTCDSNFRTILKEMGKDKH